jgi:protein-S-isoprenylcysteine O-methyltransferase Ste14
MVENTESEKPSNGGPAVCINLPGISLASNGITAVIIIAILLLLAALTAYIAFQKMGLMLWVSCGLWVGFIGYWNAAASNSAPTRSSESQGSRQLHQLLMYGALALAFVRVPGLGGRWLPTTYWLASIGLGIQVGSGFVAVWARHHLGRNWSGAITAKVDHQLVRTGPYRLVRHPIYSGMLGMFLGTAIVSGQLHGLLAVVIIAGAYWRKIRLEEHNLRNVFGAEYDEYRKRSRAIIPGLL